MAKFRTIVNPYIYKTKKAGRLDNHLLGLLDRSHEKTLYLIPSRLWRDVFFYYPYKNTMINICFIVCFTQP